ncbi:MmcQ/YjbR family DNA-binding protein [Nocardioides sp. SYSU DS0663]|uniref:MmcQ/YjbR family DNA-binding protein n=1 Tax=Nocardioides sp. SYSU DS0663 TaxID=3416445 RepID=UPI003F4CA1DD
MPTRPARRRERLQPAPDVVARLSAAAAALPGAVEEDAWTGVRWRVRGRTFAHVLVAEEGYASSYVEAVGGPLPATVLTFRSSGEELLALTHAGWPFWSVPWSEPVVGLVLDDGSGHRPDWGEVAELVTESWRTCAPQRLVRELG